MRRILLCVFFVLCAVGRAAFSNVPDSIDIKWMVDGNLYSQSTCEYGGDVIVPNIPTKRGHTFVGWRRNYIELEYLESTGTQYIDTGIRGNMSYTYEIDFRQTNTKECRNWGVFSTNKFEDSNMSLTWSKGWGVRWGSETGGDPNIVNLFPIDTERHVLKIINGSVYWDGIFVGKSAGHEDHFLFDFNPFLGTVNPGGNKPINNASSRYYSYKVWNYNEVLMQDFIPVLDHDGVPCMYDRVTNEFFYNQGTGQFIAGPIKS